MSDQTAGPRKVMFVVPSMGLGGAERQAFLLLDELDPSRWIGSLLTLDSGGHFFDLARAKGHPVLCLGIRSRIPFVGLLRLRREIKRQAPEVVLLRGFSATTLGRIAVFGLRSRPAVVVAEHSTGRQAGRTRLHDLVDAILRYAVDGFIGVAHGQLDYLVREKHIPAKRLHIIPNGIDYDPYVNADRGAAREELGVPESAFVVGIVAAIRPEKDHATFLRAAGLLNDQARDCQFFIVGDGPMRLQVEREVAALGLRDCVHLLGARTDVERLLAGFDVFTLSSNTVETLPMSVLEAMGSAVAVVATDVGGLPELVEEGVTGLLVPPSCPEALAAAWRTLHDNRPLARNMGRAGRERALGHFSVGAMARAHEVLFDRLSSEGGSR